ncbi:MAG: hypothetical protein AAGF19_09940 [Pseudomonadota bacterium]
MSYQWIGVGLLTGVVSALAFVSGLSGDPALVLLTALAQVPLFMAGLGWRWITAAVGAVAGAILLLVMAGPGGAISFLLVTALAPLVLTNRAVLSQYEEDGTLIYYPAGRLLLWLAAIGCLVPFSLLALLGVTSGDIDATLMAFAAETLERPELAPAVADLKDALERAGQPASDADLQRLFAGIAPVAAAAVWTGTTAISGLIAHAAMVRSKLSLRPALGVNETQLPTPALAALIGAFAVSFIPGLLGLAASIAVAVLGTVYFFLGLSVTHDIARAWPGRAFVLALFYITLVLVPGFAISVILVALIDQIFGLRRRLMNQIND